MKKVLTFGVFDYFHLGHLRLLKNCKELGDYLIVAVQNGDIIKKYKPSATVLYSTAERTELISALELVDEVIVYNDVDIDIKNIDFDILAIGEDQNHAGFQKAVTFCEQAGKLVCRMQRTQGISSSAIKGNIF